MCGQTNFSFVCFVSIQYLTRSEISVEGCALHYLLEASSLGFRDSVSIGSSVGLLGLVRAFWHILELKHTGLVKPCEIMRNLSTETEASKDMS